MKVAVCWEDGVGRPWVVGVGADSSPVLVADGPELFAVLDNPALEWVDPVGVGEPVAEFRGLYEASCDQPVELHQVVIVGHGDVSPPFAVAQYFSKCDGLGHHQKRRGRTRRWQGFGSLVPAVMQIFEDGMGEAMSVPVVTPLGDDSCCAAQLLARPGGVVDGSELPLREAGEPRQWGVYDRDGGMRASITMTFGVSQ